MNALEKVKLSKELGGLVASIKGGELAALAKIKASKRISEIVSALGAGSSEASALDRLRAQGRVQKDGFDLWVKKFAITNEQAQVLIDLNMADWMLLGLITHSLYPDLELVKKNDPRLFSYWSAEAKMVKSLSESAFNLLRSQPDRGEKTAFYAFTILRESNVKSEIDYIQTLGGLNNAAREKSQSNGGKLYKMAKPYLGITPEQNRLIDNTSEFEPFTNAVINDVGNENVYFTDKNTLKSYYTKALRTSDFVEGQEVDLWAYVQSKYPDEFGDASGGVGDDAMVSDFKVRLTTTDPRKGASETIPDGWFILNAPRPIMGTAQWNGDFLSGRFYVGINPKDQFAKQNLADDLKLDARLVAFVDQKTIVNMYLNTLPVGMKPKIIERYKNSTLDKMYELVNLSKINDLPYAEYKALRAKADANDLVSEILGGQSAPVDEKVLYLRSIVDGTISDDDIDVARLHDIGQDVGESNPLFMQAKAIVDAKFNIVKAVSESYTYNPLYQSVIDGAAVTTDLIKQLIIEGKKDPSNAHLKQAVKIIVDKVKVAQ